MPRLSLAALALLAGCTSSAYEAWLEENEKYATSGEVTTGDLGPTSANATGGADPSTSAADTEAVSTVADDTTHTNGTTCDGDATDTDPASPPVGEADKPSIVSVELPAKLYAAGAVPLVVETEHTSSVQVVLDGADAGQLAAAGDGRFVGELAVRGAIDNGSHEVEVIATSGPYEDARLVSYEVSTPKPGTMAWFKAGPAGSRTARLARTPEGDLLEGGQVVINKVTRPSLRKRSALTGAELFAVTLDTREGSVADLAVLPDGRVWIAMNVRTPGDPSPQPRIALFDAAGEFTGIEAPGDVGQEVRGIAGDADGGCFAVGFAQAEKDLDVGFWRVDGDGVQTLGTTWDYVPKDNLMPPHAFSDFATDVVIAGDIAWVIGASHGNHDLIDEHVRGLLVPLDLHTGEVAGPVIVAPASGKYRQSVFFGGTRHPDGVIVTGHGCDETCTAYRIEIWLFSASGQGLWHQWDAGVGARSGHDVALDSQGRVIIGGSITQSGAPRGYVFARLVHGDLPQPLFEHWFPASGPSEVFGVLVNDFDTLFAAGVDTANGEAQARTTRIHG